MLASANASSFRISTDSQLVSSAIDLVAPGGLMILDDTNIDYISEIADACVSSGAFVEEKILDTIGYQHRILRRVLSTAK